MQYHCSSCRDTEIAYATSRGQERASAIATYKLERGCIDCGYRDHPDALDLDHVNGEKIRSVSQMTTYSLERLLLELDKCEVRCANCHRIETARRRRNGGAGDEQGKHLRHPG